MINFNQALIYKCHVDKIARYLDIPRTKVHGFLRRKFNYSSYKKLTMPQYQTATNYMHEHFEAVDFEDCQSDGLVTINMITATRK